MKAWNQIYKNKPADYTYYNLHEAREDLQCVVEHFQKNKVKTVVDLGCGVGRNLIPLVKMGFEASGIDYSEEAVKQTKNLLTNNKLNANIIIGNIYKPLPYKDNSFDVLISVQVIQHAYESDLQKVIREIQRILKPGGYIFVTVCGRYSNRKIRPCLVKTTKKIGFHTYIPTEGNEKGQVHFIYSNAIILKHFKNFSIEKIWKDSRDYYCFIAKKR